MRVGGWEPIPAIVVEMDDLTAEIASIDENLRRAELTPAERAWANERRKVIYEKLHPETTAGAIRAAGMNRAQGRGDVAAIVAATFTTATAKATGQSENLHRSDLDDLDRKLQVARWIQLTIGNQERARKTEGVSGHHVQKLSARGRIGEGRPESGVNAAVRELGVGRTEAQRALKVARLTPEEQGIAREVGLANNGTALEAAVRAPDFTPSRAYAILHMRR